MPTNQFSESYSDENIAVKGEETNLKEEKDDTSVRIYPCFYCTEVFTSTIDLKVIFNYRNEENLC